MFLPEELRVLDLCDEKGSFCSKLLAAMGAEVIKIEKPGGDSSRMIGPFTGVSPHPEKSLSFFYNNTNKKSITLNLESCKGRDIYTQLVKKADIITESFVPGYLDSLGVGFNSLIKINPALIFATITGFGQNGPRKDQKSCDIIASAYGGQMFVSGYPSMPPLKSFGDQSYFTASLYAAIGILLALRKRSKTGKGEHIDISLQESAVSCLDHVMVRYFHEHVISERQGNRHWNKYFYILKCRDGFIHITPFENWLTLIELLDNEGMAKDLVEEKWKDETYRIDHADHFIQVIQEWTMTHTSNELFEMGQSMRFPWAPVCRPEQVLASPQLSSRNFFLDYRDSDCSVSGRYPGLPYKSNLSFETPHRRAPQVGEDNYKIYHELLEINEKELKRLSSQGII